MSSYRQLIYHIIFRTKNSEKTLDVKHNIELYKYIHGIIKNKHCKLYRINGMEDHIHILTEVHPSIAIADFIRDIKTSTSFWLKQNDLFPYFNGWAEGYAALSYTYRDKDMIISYIKNQQEHHKLLDFKNELQIILEEHGITVDPRFFP